MTKDKKTGGIFLYLHYSLLQMLKFPKLYFPIKGENINYFFKPFLEAISLVHEATLFLSSEYVFMCP